MKKIDLIIDALRQAYEDTPGWVEKVNEAIYAARELRELKPVAYTENPINFYIRKQETGAFIYVSKEKTPTFYTPLIALDEMTK
jgi:hypothetical protein